MSETNPNPTPADNPGDNATIRELRAQIDASNKAAREAAEKASQFETKLKEIERAKLDETERLKLEIADRDKQIGDLAPIRDEHGKYVSVLEKLYTDELATVPEEKRAAVETLSKHGTWADRLELLRAARGLVGAPAHGAGTKTNPGGGAGDPEKDKPRTFDPKNPPSWGGVLTPVRKAGA
jgi:uncharacterized protein (DUF885 family)